MLAAVSAPPPSIPGNASSTNAAPGNNVKLGSVTGTGTTTSASANTELKLVVSHEDADVDGWLEVGKQNRTVVRRTVIFSGFGSVSRFSVFHCILPSIFPSFYPSLLASLLTFFPIYSLLVY